MRVSHMRMASWVVEVLESERVTKWKVERPLMEDPPLF